MKVEKAIEVIHEYWPDTNQIMWGEALETLIQCVLDKVEIINELRVLKHLIETESKTTALQIIDAMIEDAHS
jgi:flagellar biosynthesis regulator FlbT